MGYYTDYEIEVSDKSLYQEVCKELNDNTQYNDCFEYTEYPVEELKFGSDEYISISGVKWYEYMTDMQKMSEKFPGILFEVKGWGEDSEDIWVAYFRDGKSERFNALLVFAPPTI